MKPRLLDLFCRVGGASVGYARVGFEVEGVDIDPQPNYPFKFYEADAFSFPLEGYDAYHASPECKRYCQAIACRPGYRDKYEDQIAMIRPRLVATGKPYVIENVPWAKHLLHNPIMLCGTMFGLKIKRHRYFESNIDLGLLSPFGCACRGKAGYTNADKGFSAFDRGAKLISVAGHNFCVDDARVAMGMSWANQDELSQAIPPAYTEYIGKYLMQQIGITSNDAKTR